MNKVLLVLVLVSVGCDQGSSPDVVPVGVAPDTSSIPRTCVMDMTSPVAAAGSQLWDEPAQGMTGTCHIERYSETLGVNGEFNLYSSAGGVNIRLAVARNYIQQNTTADLQENWATISLWNERCDDFDGTVLWVDGPNWKIQINATCVSDPTYTIIANFSGVVN